MDINTVNSLLIYLYTHGHAWCRNMARFSHDCQHNDGARCGEVDKTWRGKALEFNGQQNAVPWSALIHQYVGEWGLWPRLAGLWAASAPAAESLRLHYSSKPFFSLLLSSLTDTTGAGEAHFCGSRGSGYSVSSLT